MKDFVDFVKVSVLPRPIRSWLHGVTLSPAMGTVRFGTFRRLEPLSRSFGFDRGLPVDRYYVQRFLEIHAHDIQGRVLEIGDDSYSRKFGGTRVRQTDILDVMTGNSRATFVGDLTVGGNIPSNAFDCVVLTQTLHLIYNVSAAIRTIHRILRPGGVVLATFPGLSQVTKQAVNEWGWYWGFTSAAAGRLFAETFAAKLVHVETFGNVLTATSFLWGLAANELRTHELEYCDPEYQLLIAVRAIKSPSCTVNAQLESTARCDG